ncbi:hypothetical protein HY632_03740 [Candidatus Uhrbacteria bacterium]|nr:hypothetical protein [Candidatus Uhrbacteria bacterium]
MPFVIGLVGEKGSGKGTAVGLLRELVAPRRVVTTRFSDVLRETLALWDIAPTRVHLQDLAKIMVDRYGADALAHAIAVRVQHADADVVVLDGIRWQADVDLLRQFSQHVLVYITANAQVRYARLVARGEDVGEREMSYEQFCAEEQKINELEIPRIGGYADVQLINAGTLVEFREQLAVVRDRIPAADHHS